MLGKKLAFHFTQAALIICSHAPCSTDFVETAIFDPGVTVSSPVFSVSFAVGVKGVEIAVAFGVTVVP